MSIFETETIESEIQTSYKPETAKAGKKESPKIRAKRMLKKENAAAIIEQVGGIPALGESVDVITNGQSNAAGFYEVIRDEWGKVDCLCVATWIINRHYIDMLVEDIEKGVLKKLVFIISNRMSQLGKGHSPNFNRMKELFSEKSDIVSFRVVNSHAKTYCMTNGVDYITVDGSGNWSENPRIENYTISNSKEKFDFRHSWMMDLCKAK